MSVQPAQGEMGDDLRISRGFVFERNGRRYDVIFLVWPVLTRRNGFDPMNGFIFRLLPVILSYLQLLTEYVARMSRKPSFGREPTRDLARGGPRSKPPKKIALKLEHAHPLPPH
jgi:hypothetical protein